MLNLPLCAFVTGIEAGYNRPVGMEWLEREESGIKRALNQWFLNPDRDQYKTLEIKANRMNLDGLPSLSSCLLSFSQLDVYGRLKSEVKLMDRIYVQSRFQIRSFPYLRTLRKLRQTSKKVFKLSLPEICAEIATTKLTRSHLLTKQSFESLQWRCLALIEVLRDVIVDSEHLVELLTQELSPSVFVHFPIVFISLAASITALSKDYIGELMLLFQRLRTFSQKNVVDFPNDASCSGFGDLPFDASLETDLSQIGIVAVTVAKPVVEKIDFKLSGRPQTQLRGRSAGPAQKPKSSLDSLGF